MRADRRRQARALSVRDITRKGDSLRGPAPGLAQTAGPCSPSHSPSARPPVTACRTSSARSSRGATRSSRSSWSPRWRRWSAAPLYLAGDRGAGAAGRQHAAGACWPAWATAAGLIGFYKAAELGPLSIVAPIGATGAIVPVVYGPGRRATRSRPPRWWAWCWPWPAPRWPRARSRRGAPARQRRYPDPRASAIWALGSAVAFGVFLTALPEGVRGRPRLGAVRRAAGAARRCSALWAGRRIGRPAGHAATCR